MGFCTHSGNDNKGQAKGTENHLRVTVATAYLTSVTGSYSLLVLTPCCIGPLTVANMIPAPAHMVAAPIHIAR